MADINTTTPPDAIDPNEVDRGGSKGPVILPEKGTHQLQTVGIEFGRTLKGYLKATLTLKVISGNAAGHEIRYQDISTKRYSNRPSNQMLDYLGACGIDIVPTTDEQYRALVERTLNTVFEAGVNWVARDPETKDEIAKDMEDFPVVDGKRQQFLIRKNDPQNTKVWARAKVTFYVSKVGKGATR